MKVGSIRHVVAVCLMAYGCTMRDTEPEIRSRVETIMGTLVEVKAVVASRPTADVDRAVTAAVDAVRRVDSLMSTYKEDSELSRVNRRADKEAVQISPETAEVVAKAIELSKKSGGAFDITVMPLLEIWGFAKGREKSVPSQTEIDEKLRLVGYGLIELDPAKREIKLKAEGAMIDLGGIAKGYAVDAAVRSLVANGVDSAIVNAGGDMYCLGDKTPGQGWRVGVRNPVVENVLLGYVRIADKAIATSGDYENYFIVDGVRYSHILDPRTGRPSASSPHSVTVLADTCTDADALATAVFVLGPKNGHELLEKIPGAEGLTVTGDGNNLKITCTSGWQKATSWEPLEGVPAR
jgi:thiamine biosynthesis lipoprotein